jgi:hypothetical protein
MLLMAASCRDKGTAATAVSEERRRRPTPVVEESWSAEQLKELRAIHQLIYATHLLYHTTTTYGCFALFVLVSGYKEMSSVFADQ